MTRSKKSVPRFYSRNPSLVGTILFLVFVSGRAPREPRPSEPADGFRMETILLAFRFFPSLFFQTSLPSGFLFPEDLLYRKQEGLYILSAFLVNTLSFFFFNFFFQADQEGGFRRRALLGRNGT